MKSQELFEKIAGYLPYKLKCKVSWCDNIATMLSVDGTNYYILFDNNGYFANTSYKNIKPILRPLSDLSKEIEVDGKRFIAGEVLSEDIDAENIGYNDHYYDYVQEKYIIGPFLFLEPYFIVQQLYRWHFDIHGLIRSGKAIDINTLKK